MDHPNPAGRTRAFVPIALTLAALIALFFVASQVQAKGRPLHCNRTANFQRASCDKEVGEEAFVARAVCINFEDQDERSECEAERVEEAREARHECREVHRARRDACEDLGQGRYDPAIDPEDFDDDLGDLSMPNPFLPLAVGNSWTYEGDGETIEVLVTDETKSIEDVPCFVVNDVVTDEDDNPVEDTDDWFAQKKNGDTWYFGEISINFELFENDDPMLELVDIEGSWKHGRDGAKAGLLIPKDGEVGDTYRQEWLAGDAEDIATILSRTYAYGEDEELDELVPEDLAELLCDGDCMVTREYSPLEPGAFERKYYSPGIGIFLEVDPEEEEIVQLVDCNVDARCALLPSP